MSLDGKNMLSGNQWIIIGVFAATIAAFAIPYGFHLKSEENNKKKNAERQLDQNISGSGNIQVAINGNDNPIIIQRENNQEKSLLEPILEVDFEIDNFGKKHILKILNDGPIPVYEIHIESHSLLFNATKGVNSASIRPKREWELIKDEKRPSDWEYIEELIPKQKKAFPIPYEELHNTYMAVPVHRAITDDNLIALQFFYITYRRKPDRNFYSLRKYLAVFKASFKSS